MERPVLGLGLPEGVGAGVTTEDDEEVTALLELLETAELLDEEREELLLETVVASKRLSEAT